jgi:eukaryotic-like serine/threonine-protein kinase
MEGQTVSHYRVREKLGGGAMGVVYKATDTRLKRTVALKFLPPELTRDETAKQRFRQEAEAASALDHPNICTIYDIDETEDGQSFLAMAYYGGGTIKNRIQEGALGVREAVAIAAQVARGLSRAHASGIVHRDVKPANLMMTNDEQVKIVDFGIAKLMGQKGLTKTGSMIGTVAYMSPEQTKGEAADHRSDIWALGITLYEMLTGSLPFAGEHPAVMMAAIQMNAPSPLKQLRDHVPDTLERIIARTLEKSPTVRYQSAAELAEDLDRFLGEAGDRDGREVSLTSALRQPKVVVALSAAVLVAAAAGISLFNRAADGRWARDEAIPEILRLTEQDSYAAAFALAEEAEQYVPDDLILLDLWPRLSENRSMVTTPAGARVYIKPYEAPESEWSFLGTTPLSDVRVPRGRLRGMIEKDGFETLDRIGLPGRLDLIPEGSLADGMVRVPARNLHTRLNGLNGMVRFPAPAYDIDRYEVTNRAFKTFVDADGYRTRELWQHDFVRDGVELSWEEAMAEFRDAAGRPGPSTWQGGTYPPGQDDYPVTGVSWYEAAAYAEFVGKRLPTVAHWTTAASPDLATEIIPLSSFGEGLAAVGSQQGMSLYGTYDMAGNAAEWGFNRLEPGEDRALLGGAWDDTSYKFFQIDSRSPWERSPSIGFRGARYDDGTDVAGLEAPIEPLTRDYANETPVSDEIFEVYRNLYAYDATDLGVTVEPLAEDSEHWTRELITINTAYGGERMPMQLFLPKGVEPPYQAILYFPGSNALNLGSVDDYPRLLFDFLVMSGRAVLFPVYDEMFERNKGRVLSFPDETQSFRDWMIRQVKDARRGLDYLVTRPDIRSDDIAYFGFSWGSRRASVLLALENRFSAAILHSGGLLRAYQLSEVDPFNFAPRVFTPVLMINGREDLIFPEETSQNVLFELLGTDLADKKHVVFDGNHSIIRTNRNQLIRASVDWLDRYLGPIQ